MIEYFGGPKTREFIDRATSAVSFEYRFLYIKCFYHDGEYTTASVINTEMTADQVIEKIKSRVPKGTREIRIYLSGEREDFLVDPKDVGLVVISVQVWNLHSLLFAINQVMEESDGIVQYISWSNSERTTKLYDYSYERTKEFIEDTVLSDGAVGSLQIKSDPIDYIIEPNIKDIV